MIFFHEKENYGSRAWRKKNEVGRHRAGKPSFSVKEGKRKEGPLIRNVWGKTRKRKVASG